MTRAGFRWLLHAHGPDRARWPARRRGAAERLLARSADARAALAEAERLAALLDAAGEPRRVPDAAMIVALAAAYPQEAAGAARRPRGTWPTLPIRFGWAPAGALAACLLLGLALGATLPTARADAVASASDIIGLASDGPDALGAGPAIQPGPGEEP